MIILSQDKKAIINFDNVEFIAIKSDQNLKFVFSRFANSENGVYLGCYDTEERAKEVLQEIVKKHSSYIELKGGSALLKGGIDIQPNIFNIPKVYEMPEK